MVDLCRGFPCANGGTCIDSDGRDFTCACAPGFEGKDCSININECEQNPCLNQGTCTDRINEFTCTCPYGFSGSVCQYMKNGSNLILVTEKPQVLIAGLVTSKSRDEWTTGDFIMVFSLAIFGIMVMITMVMICLVVRKKRRESDRKKSERLARSQNEANSRRHKCLDDDPFKGSMIVNTLREGPEIDRSNMFNLNREKSSILSKSSNNVYESNLKLSPSSHFMSSSSSDKRRSRQYPSDFSATLSRTKSNNKIQYHEAPANNLRTKSTCKLNGIQHDPLVVSVFRDAPSHHQKLWMGQSSSQGVQRINLTPPSSGSQHQGMCDPPYWSHASSSLYRSVHNLHQERPQSAYYPKSVSRRDPEFMDPKAEYVDFKSNIINC